MANANHTLNESVHMPLHSVATARAALGDLSTILEALKRCPTVEDSMRVGESSVEVPADTIVAALIEYGLRRAEVGIAAIEQQTNAMLVRSVASEDE